VLGSDLGSYAAEGERVLYFIQTHFRYVKFRMGVPVGDSVNRRGLEWCDEEKPLKRSAYFGSFFTGLKPGENEITPADKSESALPCPALERDPSRLLQTSYR